MRKIRILAAILALSLLLSGCGISLPELPVQLPDISLDLSKLDHLPDISLDFFDFDRLSDFSLKDLFGKKEKEPAAAAEAAPDASDAEDLPEEQIGTAAPLFPSRERTDGKLLPDYVHYDPEPYYAACEALPQLDDFAEVRRYYEELTAESLYIYDLYSLAYVRYAEDVSDPSAEEEHLYCEELGTEVDDRFFTACHELTRGKFIEEFRDYLGDDEVFDLFDSYEPMTEEYKELSLRESELVSDYYTLIDGMEEISVRYRGKEYDLAFFESVEAEELYSQSPRRYFEVYEAVLGEINRQAGEIYLELLDIRDRIAHIEGYDNYAEYADECLYFRDYGEEELEPLWEAARAVGPTYDECFNYVYSERIPADPAPEELVTRCGEVLGEISPLAKKWFAFMQENGLCSVGNEENRMDGAFTIDFALGKTAFVVEKMDGSISDYATFAHEFGHYTAMNEVPNPNMVLMGGCLDVFEIHSTGLQMLFSCSADGIYGTETAYQQAYDLTDMLGYVVDGCIYDEWQRWVYTTLPDSVEELNEGFRRIMLDYGTSDYYGMDYAWAWIPHNFEQPMYYISYATSGFAALQIWAKAQDDFGEAVRIWENVVASSPYEKGYCEIVADAGLDLFYEGDTAERTLYSVADRIDDMAG